MSSLELFIRSYENQYSYRHKFICHYGSQIETLVMGSSRAFCSINPPKLSNNSFILATPGQPLIITRDLLTQYKDKLTSVKTLIVELSYFSFRSCNIRDLYDPKRYTNYQVYMEFRDEKYCSFENNFISNNVNLAMKSIRYIIHGVNLPCDSLGQTKYYQYLHPDVNLDIEGRNRVINYTTKDNSMVEKNKGYIRDIISYCKEHSIRLVLYTAPTYRSYYENMDANQYAEMQSSISDIAKENDIEYYNFIDDDRFEDEDFVDGHHMSKVGAAKFTPILADTIKLANKSIF